MRIREYTDMACTSRETSSSSISTLSPTVWTRIGRSAQTCKYFLLYSYFCPRIRYFRLRETKFGFSENFLILILLLLLKTTISRIWKWMQCGSARSCLFIRRIRVFYERTAYSNHLDLFLLIVGSNIAILITYNYSQNTTRPLKIIFVLQHKPDSLKSVHFGMFV